MSLKKKIILNVSLVTIIFLLGLIYWHHTLKWDYRSRQFHNKNIENELNNSIGNKDFRAMALYGIGIYCPGFSGFDSIDKHKIKYGLIFIEGTTDAISSDAQGNFQKAASDYAKKYNVMLLSYLDNSDRQ
jgi:hypothetical protein